MTHFWPQLLEIDKKYPDHIAVDDCGRTITYKDLIARAASTGERLKKLGLPIESLIAVEIEKSTEYIIAILACWYAGYAFVPLPPSLPQERRDYIRDKAKISHSLTAKDILQDRADIIAPVAIEDQTLAYVIFTSGSTGNPKGVMVEHRGIVPFLNAQIKGFGVNETSRYLFYLSVLFDASLSDIGVCLLSGATLVMEPDTTIKDGSFLIKALADKKITHTDLPPSLLKAFSPQDLPATLKTVIIGGETCPPETVRAWAKYFNIINVYGPTETTVCTSLIQCNAETWNRPVIGNSFAGTEYHVFDDDLNVVTEGQLYISGQQLGRGYLDEPQLTADKFILHQGIRLYKTGDHVKRHANGDIEFLGRIDRQFKLRGQLIEPDEIETCLIRYPNIKHAAVIKRDEQLVAFIVQDKDLSENGLKQYLERFLPKWMIPSKIIVLENWPLTPTGKTDFSILRTMPVTEYKIECAPPVTDNEKKLWNIWKDILKHDRFGITDDFFMVGGDSLGIIRLTLEVERQGLSLTVGQLADNRTIQKMLQTSINPAANGVSVDVLKSDVKFSVNMQDLLASAKNRPLVQKGMPQHIFLTGAAGFLGSRLLIELLKKTSAQVYCIVRAENSSAGLDRIIKTLARFSIALTAEQITRLSVYVGDLEDTNFGLEKNTWEQLTNKIDAVYHCAAKVNMVLSYSDLRGANVTSTENILRFCCEGKRKHLHYASTLSVFVATDQSEGTLLETDLLNNVKYVYGGYAQTKWAAEWMLLQVPRTTCEMTHYRLGLITGDTQYGISADHDFLSMFARGVSSLRCYPHGFNDALHVDITPIDYAAAAMAELSLNGKHDIYHIANSTSLSLGRLISAIEKKTGNLKPLPHARWKEVVKNMASNDAERSIELALCRCDAEDFKKHRDMDLFQATNVTFDTTNTKKDLPTCTLTCPAPSEKLIDIYMNFIFEKKMRPKKVCIFGPESTGKSTLAERLAAHYQTVFVPEYAKELIFKNNGNISLSEIPLIAQKQSAIEKTVEQTANRILFSDTDLITTMIWSDWLFNECPEWIRDAADAQNYDLYLVMDVDTPWVDDMHRFLPNERESFLQRCLGELSSRSIKYILLSGAWEQKFEKACVEIDKLLT